MGRLLFLALALAGRPLASRQELRFEYAREQEGSSSCGLAVAASILDLYCASPCSEADAERALGRECGPDRRATLADIAAILRSRGVAAGAFSMDAAGLEAVLDSGYAPVAAHYSRPSPHFVLVLGAPRSRAGRRFLAVADPALGLEALPEVAFQRRWSGAVLLVDPSSLSPEGRGRIEAALAGSAARAELLVRGAGASASLRAALRRSFRDRDGDGRRR